MQVQNNPRFIEPLMSRIHRLQLLPPIEITSLYELPKFSCDEERILFFELNDEEEKILSQYSTTKTKLYFLLQLGYFKATQQFYSFCFEDASDDIKYLSKIYFQYKNAVILQGQISSKNILKQREVITNLSHYQQLNHNTRTLVEKRLSELMGTHPRNQDAFREILAFCNSHKIIIPGYRTFQDLFSNAITQEKNRLTKLSSQLLPKSMQKSLDDILAKEDTISQLTLLKNDQKNFSFTALRKEVGKIDRIRDLYRLSKEVIPKLNLSKNCIRYYCELVEQYTSYRLKQFGKPYARLYVLCYIHYRYEQISDHLVISFQYHVNQFEKKAKEYVDKCEQEYNSESNINLPNVSKLLRWMVSDKIEKTLPYSIILEKAFNILPQDQFIHMANFLDGKKFDKEAVRWGFYGNSSRQIAIYLRGTFLALEFSHIKTDSQLMRAITFLKKHYNSNKTPSQMDLSNIINLVPRSKRNKMYHIKKNTIALDPARFEFFVYSRIAKEIEMGLLFCTESLSYKDLKDDFVSKDRLINKEKLAKDLGYPRIISLSSRPGIASQALTAPCMRLSPHTAPLV